MAMRLPFFADLVKYLNCSVLAARWVTAPSPLPFSPALLDYLFYNLLDELDLYLVSKFSRS